LLLRSGARNGVAVFPEIGSEKCPSGDLVPGGAAPYLKADWDRRMHDAKEQG
jgi:hypothetical protein